MPSLRLFGRRWALASDDVPLIAAPVALFHAAWTACLGAGVALTAAWPPACGGRAAALAALGGLLGTAALTTGLAGWLTVEGLKGGRRKKGRGFAPPRARRKERAGAGDTDYPLSLSLSLSPLPSGSILDVHRRARVPSLLYAFFAAATAEGGFLVAATVLALRARPVCAAAVVGTAAGRHDPTTVLRAMAYAAWGVLALVGGVGLAAWWTLPDPGDEVAW